MTEEKMYSIQYFCEHGINASFAGNQAIVNTLLKIMEKPLANAVRSNSPQGQTLCAARCSSLTWTA